MKGNTIRLIGYGFMTWLVPFVISIPLMGSDGVPVGGIDLFKSIMVVVGLSSGLFFLIRFLNSSAPRSHQGLAVGVAWLSINVLLDLAVLIPLSGMTMHAYFVEIGLRYLTIPISGAALDAYVLAERGDGHSEAVM